MRIGPCIPGYKRVLSPFVYTLNCGPCFVCEVTSSVQQRRSGQEITCWVVSIRWLWRLEARQIDRAPFVDSNSTPLCTELIECYCLTFLTLDVSITKGVRPEMVSQILGVFACSIQSCRRTVYFCCHGGDLRVKPCFCLRELQSSITVFVVCQ